MFTFPGFFNILPTIRKMTNRINLRSCYFNSLHLYFQRRTIFQRFSPSPSDRRNNFHPLRSHTHNSLHFRNNTTGIEIATSCIRHWMPFHRSRKLIPRLEARVKTITLYSSIPTREKYSTSRQTFFLHWLTSHLEKI